MNEREYLAERFEEHRTHLRAVAYRRWSIETLSGLGRAPSASSTYGATVPLTLVMKQNHPRPERDASH